MILDARGAGHSCGAAALLVQCLKASPRAISRFALARKGFIAHFRPSPRRRSPPIPWSRGKPRRNGRACGRQYLRSAICASWNGSDAKLSRMILDARGAGHSCGAAALLVQGLKASPRAISRFALARKGFIAHFRPSPRRRSPPIPWSRGKPRRNGRACGRQYLRSAICASWNGSDAKLSRMILDARGAGHSCGAAALLVQCLKASPRAISRFALARKGFIAHFRPSPRRRSPPIPWSNPFLAQDTWCITLPAPLSSPNADGG